MVTHKFNEDQAVVVVDFTAIWCICASDGTPLFRRQVSVTAKDVQAAMVVDTVVIMCMCAYHGSSASSDIILG